MGRPTDYSPELAGRICNLLAEGKSLREICDADDMPSRETVRRWRNSNEEFRGQYALAREEQADTGFDELVELSDSATPDTVNVVRLQIETRKWAYAKLKPGTYGERLDHKIAVEPINVNINLG